MNGTSIDQSRQEMFSPMKNYHCLFEQATDAIMVTDFNGDFEDINSTFCEMFGYSRDELLKTNIRTLLDAEHLKTKPLRFDLLAAGESLFTERKMVHRNGTIVYVEANAKKFLDDHVLVIARDITKRKKVEQILQKSEANLHTIFDTTDTIYVLTDTDLRVLSYNPRAFDFMEKELGRKIEVSGYLPDYFPDEKKAEYEKQMKSVLAGQRIGYEAGYPQPSGSVSWYHMRMFPISESGQDIYGLVMAISDITEKKLLEQKLVDQKVQEQKKITRAVLKAQEIERNKIGQELHDNVNQILSSIRLYLGMLSTDTLKRGDLIDRMKEFLDIAISEIRVISREQVTPQRKFNLKELIEELIGNLNDHTPLVTKFTCKVESDLPIDEDLKLNLYRIVQEQINNILKYASAKEATISIYTNQESVVVSIIDDGQGFDPLMKRKGIGISNMINRVESYDGEVRIETGSGKGCKIWISIPSPGQRTSIFE